MVAQATNGSYLVDKNSLILVTGAGGFIGTNLVQNLLDRGFTRIRCLVRLSSNQTRLQEVTSRPAFAGEIFQGNLLSQEDCLAATKDAKIIYHLAAARGEKS